MNLRWFFAYNVCDAGEAQRGHGGRLLRCQTRHPSQREIHRLGGEPLLRRSRANPTENLPQANDSTVYEVRMVGEETVHHIAHKKMMRWANKVATPPPISTQRG